MANEFFNGSIYLDNPNTRFAISMLSNKYRNNAVRGEVMQDKATGELFLRRTTDGRVVSFQQHHLDIMNLLFDLRVLLSSNTRITTPNVESSPESCYATLNFDLMRLNDNAEKDIIGTSVSSPGGDITTSDDTSVHMIYFRISKSANGFFIKLMPRDTDRGLVSWATGIYNSICKNYTGSDADILAEKAKFNANPQYEESDAVLTYDVIVEKANGSTDAYEFTSNITLGMNNAIVFPDSFPIADVKTSLNTFIRIKSIEFVKLHFVMANYRTLPNRNEYIEMYEKIRPADEHVYMRNCIINTFLDSVKDIIVTGNNFILSSIPMATITAYLAKMDSLTVKPPIILSPTRPSDGTWTENAIWVEQVRDVGQGGEIIDYHSETSFHQLELFLAGGNSDVFASLEELQNHGGIQVNNL